MAKKITRYNPHTILLVVILIGVLALIGISVISLKTNKAQTTKASWDPRLDTAIRCNTTECSQSLQTIKAAYAKKYPNGGSLTKNDHLCIASLITFPTWLSFLQEIYAGRTISPSVDQLNKIALCLE